jgi:lipoate-protein ligase A
MKASEVIKSLETLISKHGDVEVYEADVSQSGANELFEVEYIYYTKEKLSRNNWKEGIVIQ